MYITNSTVCLLTHSLTLNYFNLSFYCSANITYILSPAISLYMQACDKESVVTTLNKTLGGTSFTRAFLNPPGHLCLNLNRPIIILRTLTQVAGEGNQYGFTRSHAQGTLISLVYCPCAIRCAADYGTVSSSLSDRAGSGCGSECHQGGVLSMEEGRVCVLAGVLSNILHECGYDVHQSNPCVVSVSIFTMQGCIQGVAKWGVRPTLDSGWH